MLCVVCEEEEATVTIGYLDGFGKNAQVCSSCYSDCEPMEEGGEIAVVDSAL